MSFVRGWGIDFPISCFGTEISGGVKGGEAGYIILHFNDFVTNRLPKKRKKKLCVIDSAIPKNQFIENRRDEAYDRQSGVSKNTGSPDASMHIDHICLFSKRLDFLNDDLD